MSDRSDITSGNLSGRDLGHSKGRDWSDAIKKRDQEGICRLAQHDPDLECDGMLEAAHTVGRRYDSHRYEDIGGIVPHPVDCGLWVNPDSIVPLCQRHHRLYDAHTLDLLPYLTLDEQADAVRRVGIVRAYARLIGTQVWDRVDGKLVKRAVGEEPEHQKICGRVQDERFLPCPLPRGHKALHVNIPVGEEPE